MGLTKQELRRQYKERQQQGCVYSVTHVKTGKKLILSAQEAGKAQNLFAFAHQTGLCIHPLLAEDWQIDGPTAFTLEILEILPRKPSQTDEEFAEDIKTLEQLWLCNFELDSLYNR